MTIKTRNKNKSGKSILRVSNNTVILYQELRKTLTITILSNTKICQVILGWVNMMVTIHIPDGISLKKINSADLPVDWNSFPHPVSTQETGDKFIAGNRYCVLQIPSAVTQGDFNLLINPNHPEFKRIKIISIEKFPFDKRIFK